MPARNRVRRTSGRPFLRTANHRGPAGGGDSVHRCDATASTRAGVHKHTGSCRESTMRGEGLPARSLTECVPRRGGRTARGTSKCCPGCWSLGGNPWYFSMSVLMNLSGLRKTGKLIVEVPGEGSDVSYKVDGATATLPGPVSGAGWGESKTGRRCRSLLL